MKHQSITHPIPPLYDADSRILILGSFPSVKSREAAFFYGHPQNRFWKLIAGLLSRPVPETVEEKSRLLHENHIALWDTIQSCRIVGSSDSSIRDVVANDLTPILETAKIRKIYCNGAKSHEYYRKYIEKNTGIKAVKLPSTSPANAAFSLDRLAREWSVICQPLGCARAGSGETLLRWYDYNARILPWRSDPTPYHVWISEIMLQQTRVEAVKKYYDRWMEELPDIKALAGVPDDQLMKLWEGLGYYNRARNLKAAAIKVMEDYQGALPADYEELLKLPGIGEYTAGAIASIAFGLDRPAVDGNAYRIFARVLAEDREISKTAVRKDIQKEVNRILPKGRAGDFNQALMDLGATVCLPNGRPVCEKCPWEAICAARREDRMQDYPVKAAKKKRRVEQLGVFVIRAGDRIALHKREENGLLAGLWEFPNIQGAFTMEKAREQMESWGLPDYRVKSLGAGKHIFSHVEWEMEGYYFRVPEIPPRITKKMDWQLVSQEDLESSYALPSAFDTYRKNLTSDEGR